MTFASLEPTLRMIDYTILSAGCLWNIACGLNSNMMPTGGPTLDRAADPIAFWLAAVLHLAIFSEALFLLFTING